MSESYAFTTDPEGVVASLLERFDSAEVIAVATHCEPGGALFQPAISRSAQAEFRIAVRRSGSADARSSPQHRQKGLIGNIDAESVASVAVVGIIDAVAVRDGHFTPVLRCSELSGVITLEFADRMRKRVLQSLCRRVVVEGRLYAADADRYRLEVCRLRQCAFLAGRSDEPPIRSALGRNGWGRAR